MALNVKYKLLQNLWDPISDINTYWSKALQRLALIFMGLKFLIQTVKLPDQNSWAYNPRRMCFMGWPIDKKNMVSGKYWKITSSSQ